MLVRSNKRKSKLEVLEDFDTSMSGVGSGCGLSTKNTMLLKACYAEQNKKIVIKNLSTTTSVKGPSSSKVFYEFLRSTKIIIKNNSISSYKIYISIFAKFSQKNKSLIQFSKAERSVPPISKYEEWASIGCYRTTKVRKIVVYF
jgi:hypothetical protein